MSHPSAEPLELAVLRGWLRACKGALTYDTIARWTTMDGQSVSACTLRRALDGRLPTRRTTLAFACASARASVRRTVRPDVQSAEEMAASLAAEETAAALAEKRAAALWERAFDATRRQETAGRTRVAYVPGRITTRAGLAAGPPPVARTGGSTFSSTGSGSENITMKEIDAATAQPTA